MLSALVQSQAAIVAIVITLTLIAVQLTASAYSPRVVDIFKNNPGMRILLLLYGTSVFYGLIVLRLVEGNKGELVSQSVIWSLGPLFMSLEWCIHLALLLGILAFVALVPYISYIIDLLKPENIIKQLASKITKDVFLKPLLFSMESDFAKKLKDGPIDNLVKMEFNKNNEQPLSDKAKVSTIDEKHWEIVDGEERYKIENTEIKLNIYHNSRKDPIQPIVDIIRGSIRKYDFETTRVGLSAVTDQVINEIYPNCAEDISNSFCTRLQGVGKLAASITDEESTVEVIENLERFGKDTAGNKLEVATKEAATSLEAVGIAAVRKGTKLEDAVKKAVQALGTVGKTAVENNLGDVTMESAKSLGAIGVAAAEKGKELKEATKQVAKSLGIVGTVATEKGKTLDDTIKKELEKAIKQAVVSLEDVGKAAANNKLDEATEQAASSLKDVGKAAANFGDVVKQTITSLGVVGTTATEKGEELEKAIKQAIESLEDVGKTAVEKGLGDAARRAVSQLGNIGKTAVENGLGDFASLAALYLWYIGEPIVNAVAKNRLRFIEWRAIVSSLRVVGKTAAEKGLENAAKQAVWSISAVGRTAVEEGLEDATKDVIQALETIRETAKKSRLNDVLRKVASAIDNFKN
jgi:hypothetical protein